MAARRELHVPQGCAGDTVDPVDLGQRLVEKGEVRVDHAGYAQVVAEHGGEEEPRFFHHGIDGVRSHVRFKLGFGIELAVGLCVVDVA